MNSNGIPEMIRAAGKSRYRTQRAPCWVCMLIGVMFGMALILMLVSIAHASPACMTYTEARQIWPTKYLHWHSEHCWSYGGDKKTAPSKAHDEIEHGASPYQPYGGGRARPYGGSHTEVPLPKSKPFVLLLEQAAADPNFDIRWRTRIEQ